MSKLSEAYEKWMALQPLSSMDSARLDRKFMLDFNYNSNHIEGNTLTYGQTEVLLLMGEVIGSAKMKDLEDMKAHNLCLNLMIEDAKTTWWYDGETITFRSPRTVMLLQYLKKNPKATIAELASVLEINTSAVQKQLSNLLSKGYITKNPDSNSYLVIAVSTTK